MKQPDIKYRLLSLIGDLPHGGATLEVIFRDYKTKYIKEMSTADFQTTSNGDKRWKHSLREEFIQCDVMGLLTVPYPGFWKISKKGRQWLNEYQYSSGSDKGSFSEKLFQQVSREINIKNKITVDTGHPKQNLLETCNDFLVPLMRILDKLPNRAGQAVDVLSLFEQTYRDDLAPYQYSKNQSGHIRWEDNVRWTRDKLKEQGLIDAPGAGIWRLTDLGHQWLVEHPETLHYSAKRAESKRKYPSPSPSFSSKTKTQAGIRRWFLSSLQEKLSSYLQSILGSVQFEFIQRDNYIQIRLAGYSGCHYEIILQRGKHEIALHFEGSEERSQARLQGFEPHLGELSQVLKISVQAGNFQSRGWTQVHIERPIQPLSQVLLLQYTELVSRFVAATFPILQKIYTHSGKIHLGKEVEEKLVAPSPRYRILMQEVATIRSYLQGSSSLQLSDEKICDWVNFCYTFGMYAEGKDLFSLVSGNEVNMWYYERTKKIAKVCEQKAHLVEMRVG